MKKLTLLFLIFFSSFSHAGSWQKIDSETLLFEGIIEENTEYQKLVKIWDSGITKIIVNSPGGHTATGIRMASFLQTKVFSIEVRGQCMSSCANYLFLPAKNKNIENGIVGFHGSAFSALSNLQKTIDYMVSSNAGPDSELLMLTIFFDQKDKAAAYKAYHEYIDASKIEIELFTKLGVAQDLFIRSQRADKGMKNGKEYSFLLPTAESFEKYGVKNVIGSQNMEILNKMPEFIENKKNDYDVLLD